VLNDIAMIQIVEKKPKTSGEFAIVAGGALTAVAKAHVAEVIEIIKKQSSGNGSFVASSSSGVKADGTHTPGGSGVGTSSYLLEV
jgi:hypothetical protein